MDSLTITSLQIHLSWHNPAANRQHIEALLAASPSRGGLLVFPEMFTTGFSMQAQGIAEPPDGPTTRWMQEIAGQYQSLCMGSVIITENGHYYNRALMVDGQGLQAQYDKRHSFSLAGEDKVFTAGRERIVLPYKGWKICPQICYDLRFPTFARNRVDENGAFAYDVLIYMANWPVGRIHHWESLLRARAIENQVYVVGVNRVGEDPQLRYSGSSMVVDPMGNVLAQAIGGESILQASLDPQLLQETRERFPFWRDADPFTLQV